MSATSAITQLDTLQINNQVISTFANNDCGKVTFPNELVEIDVGKNGNVLAAINFKGFICDFEIRLVMGASDDQYLNGLLNQFMSGSPSFNTGFFTKNFVDANSNVVSASISVQGGFIQKAPEMIISANGNIEQTVALWKLRFGYWNRVVS
jgi:hypothetical protein